MNNDTPFERIIEVEDELTVTVRRHGQWMQAPTGRIPSTCALAHDLGCEYSINGLGEAGPLDD